MSDRIRDVLRGEAEPLTRFGVAIFDIPWWRRRIQRYLAPRRFLRWSQRQILDQLEAEDTNGE